MDISLSGFFAQISDLEDKITKTFRYFGFWDTFKILYFFNGQYKKI
jgi:hypothetical protein